MPVAPAFAAVGGLMGASAATATAVGVATVATGASIGLQGYSIYKTNKANKAAAAQTVEVADYNARVGLEEAKQIELDAAANYEAMRDEAAIYTSRQEAAYAASGVLNTGSALAVQAETASRLEQQIQQERNNALREAERHRTTAKLGRIYGEREASAIRTQNRISMLNGGIGILKTAAGAYQSGIFTGVPGVPAT